jgi:hypothetical protein
MPRAVEIRPPRLVLGTIGVERQARRIVQHGMAMLGHPTRPRPVESQPGARQIAFDDDRTRQGVTRLPFPARDEAIDSLPGTLESRRPHQHREFDAGAQEVTDEVRPQQPGGTGEKQVAHVVAFDPAVASLAPSLCIPFRELSRESFPLL